MLLKPEAKQNIGVDHYQDKSREKGHSETPTQSKDDEFDAQGLCDKASRQFAKEVVRRRVLTRACAPLSHAKTQLCKADFTSVPV